MYKAKVKVAKFWARHTSEKSYGFNCRSRIAGFEVSRVRCAKDGGAKIVRFFIGAF